MSSLFIVLYSVLFGINIIEHFIKNCGKKTNIWISLINVKDFFYKIIKMLFPEHK